MQATTADNLVPSVFVCVSCVFVVFVCLFVCLFVCVCVFVCCHYFVFLLIVCVVVLFVCLFACLFAWLFSIFLTIWGATLEPRGSIFEVLGAPGRHFEPSGCQGRL